MRSMLLPVWVVACGGLLLGPGAAAQSRPSAAERELQPLLQEMLVAANAHDTDLFLAPYVHDSTLVMVFNGMVVVGYDPPSASGRSARRAGGSWRSMSPPLANKAAAVTSRTSRLQ